MSFLAGFSGSAVALICYLFPLATVIGSVALARLLHRRKDRLNPLTRGFLRGPGHSLKERLDNARDDLTALMAAAIPIPLFLVASWTLQDRFDHKLTSFPVIYSIFLAAAAVMLISRIIVLMKAVRNYSLGLEAEIAIGQELDQLMRVGYHVFHDLFIDTKYNIDHVVVGQAGVFAVETKGRAKVLTNGQKEYKVEISDEGLVFPGWTETNPLTQASLNAQNLSKWLSSSTGEQVEVYPVLALPGWFIDIKSRSNVFVFNGSNSIATLGRWRPSSLSAEAILRVVHQLESKCRDIAPRAR